MFIGLSGSKSADLNSSVGLTSNGTFSVNEVFAYEPLLLITTSSRSRSAVNITLVDPEPVDPDSHGSKYLVADILYEFKPSELLIGAADPLNRTVGLIDPLKVAIVKGSAIRITHKLLRFHTGLHSISDRM